MSRSNGFAVRKDGSVSDLSIEKDAGYGIGDELVKIMQHSPKWQPAHQNGRAVHSYHTQPITLVISK